MTASSAYLHIPFCLSKCPYCAFASAVSQPGDGPLYLGALTREISARRIDAGQLHTLYIGGGTPTALAPDLWLQLVAILEDAFSFADDAEVTVEVNPVSLSPGHLRIWRDWRVTRLSVGVQSFDDAELSVLGRPHNAVQGCDALSACMAAGFATSLDLIFATPGGTLPNWARTLRQAAALRPAHISLYQLSLEPGTPFAQRYEDANLSDGYAEYRYAQWFLPRKEYGQYEVASFARPGQESRHNLVYWADKSYLGLGPSATGYLNGIRYKNTPSLADYVEKIATTGDAARYEESLSNEAAARQAAILALRTTAGIDWRAFAARYGAGYATVIKDDLLRFPPNLVHFDGVRATLTPKGLRVANRIWAELI